jgi:hypothetical protein
LRLIYKIIRLLRRLPRRLFGRRAPKFVGDVYDFIKYANWIELIPTAAAIVVCPHHFYRRLTRTLDKKGVFLDPLHFAFNGLSVLITGVFFLYPRLAAHEFVRSLLNRLPGALLAGAEHLTKLKMGFVIVTFALLTPIWIVPVSVLIYALLALLSRLLQSDIVTDKGRSQRLESLDHELLLVPLALDVYRRLDKKRFGWSVCYYGVTAFVLIQVVAVVYTFGAYGFTGVMRQVPGNISAALLLGPTVIAEALLIRPYIELLRASCVVPPIQFHRAAYMEIKVRSEILLGDLTDLSKLPEGRSRKKARWWLPSGDDGSFRANLIDSILSSADQLRSEIYSAASKMKVQEFDFRHLDESWLSTLRRERAQAFQDALGLDNLERAAKDPEVPDEVEQKICQLAVDSAIFSAEINADLTAQGKRPGFRGRP